MTENRDIVQKLQSGEIDLSIASPSFVTANYQSHVRQLMNEGIATLTEPKVRRNLGVLLELPLAKAQEIHHSSVIFASSMILPQRTRSSAAYFVKASDEPPIVTAPLLKKSALN
jgi:hypothetical protein